MFYYNCVKYIKFDTCAKFHGHRSNKETSGQSYDGRALMPPPPPSPQLTVQKQPMSNTVLLVLKNRILVLWSHSLVFNNLSLVLQNHILVLKNHSKVFYNQIKVL